MLLKLGFGKCNLSVQAPADTLEPVTVESLAGKRIVTSFPHVAKTLDAQRPENAAILKAQRLSEELKIKAEICLSGFRSKKPFSAQV